MIKKDKFFKISNKTRSVNLDPSLNLKLNLMSIKDLLKIKINSSFKIFFIHYLQYVLISKNI